MVKEFLSQKGVAFKEHDVSRDSAAAQDLLKRTGQRGVPVTIVDGQTIIGFDRARLEQAFGQRPSFGIAIADASTITARQGTGITFGAYVGRVRSGSIADKLGLMQGDIITEVNMRRITNASDLEYALSTLNQGSRVSVVFLRGNKNLTTEGAW